VPPFDPVQLQIHGPVPLTSLAVPAAEVRGGGYSEDSTAGRAALAIDGVGTQEDVDGAPIGNKGTPVRAQGNG